MMYNPRKVEMNAVILKLNGCVIKIIRLTQLSRLQRRIELLAKTQLL